MQYCCLLSVRPSVRFRFGVLDPGEGDFAGIIVIWKPEPTSPSVPVFFLYLIFPQFTVPYKELRKRFCYHIAEAGLRSAAHLAVTDAAHGHPGCKLSFFSMLPMDEFFNLFFVNPNCSAVSRCVAPCAFNPSISFSCFLIRPYSFDIINHLPNLSSLCSSFIVPYPVKIRSEAETSAFPYYYIRPMKKSTEIRIGGLIDRIRALMR